jgi:predicted restriction endonuclease
MALSWKKYYKMAFFGVIGISIYLLLKRNPNQGKNMLMYANNMVKYMPIDKSSIDMISPIFDLTSNSQHSFMESFNNIESSNPSSEQRILNSGKNSTKRSVSETKKKYVAAQQDWKCSHCGSQLNAWFEVDHKIRLEHGGGNDVNNLVALCRECHGKKTAMENMGI